MRVAYICSDQRRSRVRPRRSAGHSIEIRESRTSAAAPPLLPSLNIDNSFEPRLLLSSRVCKFSFSSRIRRSSPPFCRLTLANYVRLQPVVVVFAFRPPTRQKIFGRTFFLPPDAAKGPLVRIHVLLLSQ